MTGGLSVIKTRLERLNDKIDTLTSKYGPGGDGIQTLAQQPDGDVVRDKTGGLVASFTGQLTADETVTVTDGFVDSDGWGSIEIFVAADEGSALEGVKLDYTDDVQNGQTVRATRSKTFTGESVDIGFETFKFETDLDGFRVRYANGDTATDISLFVTLRSDEAFDSANYVGKNTLGDNFVRVGTSEAEEGLKIGQPTSLFGDLESIERTTLLDVSSSFGTSTLRDETGATGSGAIAEDPNDNGEIELATGTTPDSTIDLRTAAYGRYTPGYSAQAGIGVRLIGQPWPEGEGRWGYFSDSGVGSGFYFGYDATEDALFIAVSDSGTEKIRVYESDWNGQDFQNVFDKPLAPEDGYIYQIDYSWYGYGIINFQIVAQTINTISGRTPRQETITVHSVVIDGDTSIPDPNEPIRAELENGANGADNRLAIGGRQFSVFGEESDEVRITSDTRFDAPFDAGAWTYIMSWRRGDVAGDANARLDFADMDLVVDQTCKIALVLNADVTGTAYDLPTLTPQGETLLEVSKTGTFNGIGTGRKVWEGSIFVGERGNSPPGTLDVDAEVDFGQNGELTLLIQGEGGGGAVETTMRLEEDW